jgi:hypothetical protein
MVGLLVFAGAPYSCILPTIEAAGYLHAEDDLCYLTCDIESGCRLVHEAERPSMPPF